MCYVSRPRKLPDMGNKMCYVSRPGKLTEMGNKFLYVHVASLVMNPYGHLSNNKQIPFILRDSRTKVGILNPLCQARFYGDL